MLMVRLPDYKSTVTLVDTTTQDEDEGIVMNIFRSQEEMPHFEVGDVVIVYCAKQQSYNSSTTSLLTNIRTDIHVYDRDRLSKCKSSRLVSSSRRDPTRKSIRVPTANEDEYVLSLYETIDRRLIPNQDDFKVKAEQSLNLRDKFRLLKDVREGIFADLVVEVAKQPYELGDKVCLWVSDYTEHSDFFNKLMDGIGDGLTRDGDPYGYTGKFNKIHNSPLDDERRWMGPCGKRSIQITCWEPHADFIRQEVKAGDWVRLRNVQIGWGRGTANIEGFLRGDRQYPDRIYVDMLDAEADRETINPHLKDALRRKRDYEKEHKRGSNGQGKRSAPDELPQKASKSKRQRLRSEKQREFQEREIKAEEKLNLNKLIICENQGQSIVPLSAMLEPVPYRTTIKNEATSLDLPFTNVKFRTQVRVVDFHPSNLQDFAVRVKRNKYACLSDNGNESGGDASSTSSSSEIETERGGYNWNWRFALKVEEVSAVPSKTKKRPASTWVLVNNQDAQLLTDLDARDLHASENSSYLDNLRELMFTLWGNLEECKAREEATKKKRVRGGHLEAPPVDSDEEGEGTRPPSSQLTNKPFRCCLQQYGVRVEAGKGEDNAGEGYRWQRMFGLFGTKISI